MVVGMSGLLVLACGPGATLQDPGRFGLQRFGVSPAGAMDPVAVAAANALAGNPLETAVIECALLGLTLEALGDAVLASVGSPAFLNGASVGERASFAVREGDRIVLGPVREGLYGYLAVAGGFANGPEMGSLSMHRRSGIGGAGLAAGQRLSLARMATGGERRVLASLPGRAGGPIRVVLGPQDDFFTDSAIETFLSSPYRVSPRSDRMGVRLAGPALEHARGYNIVSDGIVTGHIQVPGDGQPIILMRDRQTTGGYPKIATVITADLPRLAQSPPGMELRFEAVSREDAVAALAQLRRDVEALPLRVEDAGAGLSSERLLSVNLISGVQDAEGDIKP